MHDLNAFRVRAIFLLSEVVIPPIMMMCFVAGSMPMSQFVLYLLVYAGLVYLSHCTVEWCDAAGVLPGVRNPAHHPSS